MDPPRSPFSVRHHTGRSPYVLEVLGDIDIFTAPEFSAALELAHAAPRVIVDLSSCGYIDSTGISTLFRWQESTGGKLRLVVAQDHKIRRILHVTRVDSFIDIFPSIEAAKA